MARKPSALNKSATPVSFLEENFIDTKKENERKIQDMRDLTVVKSPFLVGTIDEVNRRIGKLDKKLHQYTALQADSRMSDSVDEVDDFIRRHQRAENETAKYEGKSFFPQHSTAHGNKANGDTVQSKQEGRTDEKKPKFLELHQFPGFSADDLTPLPNDVTAMEILSKVAQTQTRVHKSPRYKPVFEELFYSDSSKVILQDLFWWFFLENYQRRPDAQNKYFNRVSFNYIDLLMAAKQTEFKETFLKTYPELLAQSLYCAICHSFPDSYSRFNDAFKDLVVYTAYQWIIGCKPAPQLWTKWNLDILEPASMKIKQGLLEPENKNSSTSTQGPTPIIDFSAVERATSQNTINNISSSRKGSVQVSQGSNRPTRRTTVRQTAALAPMTPHDDEEHESEDHRMTTIKETDEQSTTTKPSKQPIHRKPNLKSHIVGQSAKMQSCAFDIYGRSPLVEHYLRVRNVRRRTGYCHLVRRQEVLVPVPLSGETYHDLVVQEIKRMKKAKQNFTKGWQAEQQQWKHFANQQAKVQREYLAKENALLSQSREVKRLSDLIMLEATGDDDTSIGNVADELAAALQAQVVN